MAHAVTKYNPHTGEYHQVPEDWELKFNPVSNQYEFAPPKSNQPTYNAYTSDFNMNEATEGKYNPSTNKIEATHRDSELVLNPITGQLEYVPKKQ